MEGELDESVRLIGKLAKFSLHMARETKGAFNPAIYSLMNTWGFTTNEYRIPEDEKLKELLSHSHYQEVKLDNYITEKLEGYFQLNETSRGIPVFVIHRES